jgi:putative inorganic carbon (HCO3(-)) transporter
MAIFLWIKSRKKVGLGIVLGSLAFAMVTFMPAEWHEKMHSIETYQEDASAMGRVGAWQFAWNLAKNRPIGGGGFDTFQTDAYARYAPTGYTRELDPHSIWFQILAEHGFVGAGLYILLWILAWRTGSNIIKMVGKRPELQWAKDLAAMIQAALVGFWVGGSFLGLAYWDYPYILVVILVLTKGAVASRLTAAQVDAQSALNSEQPRLRTQGP